MKKNHTRARPPTSAREQLASLRTKQERHERLAQQHADSAKRLWLRRVLLELSQEKAKPKPKSKPKKKADSRVRKKVGRRRHAAT
jgi:hypothetical protein